MTDELIIDWEGRLLKKEDIAKLKKTEAGRKRLHSYIFGARAGYATQQILSYLENEVKAFGRKLTEEEMQNVCGILYFCVFEAHGNKIEEWIRETARWLTESGHHPTAAKYGIKGRWDC